MKTGSAGLPLHTGQAPSRLFGRMVRLSRTMVEYIVAEWSAGEALISASRMPAKVDNAEWASAAKAP